MSDRRKTICRTWIVIVVSIFSLSATAFASRGGSFGESSSGSFGGGPNSNWTLLSYESLSQLCVDINTDSSYLTIWQLIGVDAPLTASLSLVGDYWVISVTNNGTKYWFTNNSGYPYYACVEDPEFSDDMIGLLDEIAYQSTKIKQLVNSCQQYLWDIADSASTIAEKITSADASLATINIAASNIETHLDAVHDLIDGIHGVLTGTAFSTMMSDISTIKTNTTSIVNWQTSAKTHIMTIRDNTASMVTLLQGLQSPTITGDVMFDTSTLEQKLDDIDDTLRGGLYSGSSALLNSIIGFLNQRVMPALTAINSNIYDIGTDVSTMLTYQQEYLHEIRDDVQDLSLLAEHQIGLLTYSDKLERYSAAELLYEIYGSIEFFPQKMDDLYRIVRWQWETQQNINTTLNQISDAISDLGDTSAENITNITINEENKVYDVFYITGEDGTEESIADLNGDILSAAGKLLNFFFKVAFDGAIESVDSTIDGMTDFYLNDAAVLEGSLWE